MATVSVPSQYQADVKNAATALGIPQSIVAAQIQLESSWDPNAVSSAGAEGIAQFEPGTFSEYGPKGGSPYNPSDAFQAYVAYMSDLLKWSGGSVQKALAGYNAGQGNWQAGLGYASTIFSWSGLGVSDVVAQPGQSVGIGQIGGGGGTGTGGGTGGTGGGGASQTDWSQSIGGFIGGITGLSDTAAMLGDVFGPISNVFKDFGQGLNIAINGLIWLVNPMNWLRILAAFIGVGAVVTGAVLVAGSA